MESTGNRIVDLRPRVGQEVTDPVLKLNLDDAPFWYALDHVAKQARLRITPHLDRKSSEPVVGVLAIALSEPEPAPPMGYLGGLASGPIVYCGPFRLALKQVTATRRLEEANQDTLSYVVQIAWEPRLRPLLLRLRRNRIHYSMGSDQLTTTDPGSAGTIKLLGEAAVEITLRTPLPPRELKTLRQLTGEFVAVTPQGDSTFELPRLTPGEKSTHQQLSVTLSSFRIERSTRRWLIGMALEYPAGALDLESHQTWAMEGNKIWLRHKQTRRLWETQLNPEIGIDEGRAIHITYAFADVPGKPEDWELVYRAPSPPVAYPVRFNFTELPLP